MISGLCVTDDDRARLKAVHVPGGRWGGESTYGFVIRKEKHRGELLNEMLSMLSVGAQAQA